MRLDVLTGDTDPNFVDVDVGLIGGLADGTAYGLGGVGDILHDTMFHAFGISLAESEDFHLAVFSTHTDKACDFCGTDVKAYNDFVFHNVLFFIILYYLLVQTTCPLKRRLIFE